MYYKPHTKKFLGSACQASLAAFFSYTNFWIETIYFYMEEQRTPTAQWARLFNTTRKMANNNGQIGLLTPIWNFFLSKQTVDSIFRHDENANWFATFRGYISVFSASKVQIPNFWGMFCRFHVNFAGKSLQNLDCSLFSLIVMRPGACRILPNFKFELNRLGSDTNFLHRAHCALFNQ